MVESKVSIEQIKKSNQRSDGGARKKINREVKESIDKMLKEFFYKHVNHAVVDHSIENDCLQSFLEHCQKYLYSK